MLTWLWAALLISTCTVFISVFLLLVRHFSTSSDDGNNDIPEITTWYVPSIGSLKRPHKVIIEKFDNNSFNFSSESI